MSISTHLCIYIYISRRRREGRQWRRRFVLRRYLDLEVEGGARRSIYIYLSIYLFRFISISLHARGIRARQCERRQRRQRLGLGGYLDLRGEGMRVKSIYLSLSIYLDLYLYRLAREEAAAAADWARLIFRPRCRRIRWVKNEARLSI